MKNHVESGSFLRTKHVGGGVGGITVNNFTHSVNGIDYEDYSKIS